jgi:hypothetical protein
MDEAHFWIFNMKMKTTILRKLTHIFADLLQVNQNATAGTN